MTKEELKEKTYTEMIELRKKWFEEFGGREIVAIVHRLDPEFDILSGQNEGLSPNLWYSVTLSEDGSFGVITLWWKEIEVLCEFGRWMYPGAWINEFYDAIARLKNKKKDRMICDLCELNII